MLREVVVVQVVEDLAEAVEAAVVSVAAVVVEDSTGEVVSTEVAAVDVVVSAAAVVVEDSTEEVVASEEEEEGDSHWLLVIRL